MHNFTKKLQLAFLGLIFAGMITAGTAAPAFSADGEDDLVFSLKPYLWLPTIDGELKYTTLPSGSSGSPQVSVSPDDLFEAFDFGAIMASELRKGKWSIFSDFIYMQISSSDSKVKAINFGGTIVTTSLDIGTEVEVKEFLTTATGGYTVIDGERLKMDLLAGFRYLWIESELKWRLSATVTGPLGGGADVCQNRQGQGG